MSIPPSQPASHTLSQISQNAPSEQTTPRRELEIEFNSFMQFWNSREGYLPLKNIIGKYENLKVSLDQNNNAYEVNMTSIAAMPNENRNSTEKDLHRAQKLKKENFEHLLDEIKGLEEDAFKNIASIINRTNTMISRRIDLLNYTKRSQTPSELDARILEVIDTQIKKLKQFQTDASTAPRNIQTIRELISNHTFQKTKDQLKPLYWQSGGQYAYKTRRYGNEALHTVLNGVSGAFQGVANIFGYLGSNAAPHVDSKHSSSTNNAKNAVAQPTPSSNKSQLDASPHLSSSSPSTTDSQGLTPKKKFYSNSPSSELTSSGPLYINISPSPTSNSIFFEKSNNTITPTPLPSLVEKTPSNSGSEDISESLQNSPQKEDPTNSMTIIAPYQLVPDPCQTRSVPSGKKEVQNITQQLSRVLSEPDLEANHILQSSIDDLLKETEEHRLPFEENSPNLSEETLSSDSELETALNFYDPIVIDTPNIALPSPVSNIPPPVLEATTSKPSENLELNKTNTKQKPSAKNKRRRRKKR